MDTKIVLKSNNYATNRECCGLCGSITGADVPTDLFIEGTFTRVCDDCVVKEGAPELLHARNIFNRFAGALWPGLGNGAEEELKKFFQYLHELLRST